MGEYLSRITDNILNAALKSSGAVLIEGPKWCGKTSTAKEFSNSTLFMQDPDHREENILAASLKPSLLLEGESPKLIDEWQVAPVLWDAVRHQVDVRQKLGQFILTGSVTPALDGMRSHTGTGRIARIRMRTMSLYESQESDGAISLSDLFNEVANMSAINKSTLEDLSFYITRGGWPGSLKIDKLYAEQSARDYLDSLVYSDVSNVDGSKKDPQKMMALIRSISRNIATEVKQSTIIKDMSGDDNESITSPTLRDYLNILERLFVLENLEAWSPNLRSATVLRKSPKRHFVDPSIAAASLGINHSGLLKDLNTFGFMFESLCIRDLKIYAESLGGKVYHYRDRYGLECDAIIVLRDGRWGAVEIKLGVHEIEKAVSNLKTLEKIVDTSKMNEPSFLMVLTGTTLSYQREDGVYVVSIASLKD